ncbi:MAG: carbohydrate ABC transporter permease [Propionicimonas sp.]
MSAQTALDTDPTMSDPPTPVPPQGRRPRRWKPRAALKHLFMIPATVVWLIPIVWMFVLAVSDNKLLQLNSQTLVPQGFTLGNIVGQLTNSQIPRWFFNSLIVTGVTTIGTVVLSSMAGYAFGRLRFRFRRTLLVLTLAGLMVPREAMFIPLYLMFSSAGQLNTYPAMFLPRIALPLGVFIMTQFFLAVPKEMEEAARIDGAGHVRTFLQVMVPLAKPAMASLAIFTFVQSWNDYLWPLVVATKPDYYTLTVGLAQQQASFEAARSLGDVMARGVIGSLPLIIVFLLFQRHLMRGISLGSGEK